MKKMTLLTLLLSGLIMISVSNAAEFGGVWENVDNNTSGIKKVLINVNDSDALVQVVASCSPSDCNWGTNQATASDSSVNTVFENDFKKVSLTIEFVSNDSISVQTSTENYQTGRNHKTEYVMQRGDDPSTAPIGMVSTN